MLLAYSNSKNSYALFARLARGASAQNSIPTNTIKNSIIRPIIVSTSPETSNWKTAAAIKNSIKTIPSDGRINNAFSREPGVA